MIRRFAFAAALVAAVSFAGRPAAAQSVPSAQPSQLSFGLGPEFSFVRGNDSSGTPSTRLVGGTLRLMTGPHTALEGSLNYRSYLNDTATERTRETPIEGSLLIFVTRSALAPYFSGGVGLYSQAHDTLNALGLVTATTTERRLGWHLGVGAEIKITTHAAFFADYRFRFVKFGDPTDADQELIHVPGTTVIPALQDVKVSHEGSMWTTGVAFYF